MTTIAIKITLDAGHISRTDQLCRSLTQLGMTVETSMPEIGVIFGSADHALLPQMQALNGVTDAVPERNFRGTDPD